LSAQRNLPRATQGTALFPGLADELNAVTNLSIQKGGPTPAVTLHQQGGHWMVTERADYPADVAKLRKLLLSLSEAKIREQKTSDPAKFPLIGVEDPALPNASGAQIEVTAPDGKHAVIVGKPTLEGSFVRRRGENASFVVEPSISFETEARYWIDGKLLDLPAAKIQSIEVKPANGPGYLLRRAAPVPSGDTAGGAAPGAGAANASGAAVGGTGTAGGAAPGSGAATAGVSATNGGSAAAAAATATASASASAVPPAAAAPPGDFTLQSVPAGRQAAAAQTLAISATAFGGLNADDVAAASSIDCSAPSTATVTLADGATVTVTGCTAADKHWIEVAASQDTALQAKAAGRAFEISSYRYDNVFRPLEQLLVPVPAKVPPVKTPAARTPPATPPPITPAKAPVGKTSNAPHPTAAGPAQAP
jgi:hypothetical protein